MDWPAKGRWRNLNEKPTAFHARKSWMGSLLRHGRDASGQYYRRNRYCDATSGRFTQEDPIGLAGGLNLYGYANGDPITYDDPYGLCPPMLCGAAAGALIGAGIKMANNYIDDRPLTEDVGKWAAGGALAGATLGLGSAAAEGLAVRWMAHRAVAGRAVASAAGAGAAGRVMLEAAKQGKHIPGHNNYIAGRSPFTHPDPQGLLDRFAGTGQTVAGVAGQPGFRERVNFGTVIGQIDVNGVLTNTTKGIIHYSKNGAHIVPANP